MTLGKSLFLSGRLSLSLSAEPLRDGEAWTTSLFEASGYGFKKMKMCPKYGNKDGG